MRFTILFINLHKADVYILVWAWHVTIFFLELWSRRFHRFLNTVSIFGSFFKISVAILWLKLWQSTETHNILSSSYFINTNNRFFLCEIATCTTYLFKILYIFGIARLLSCFYILLANLNIGIWDLSLFVRIYWTLLNPSCGLLLQEVLASFFDFRRFENLVGQSFLLIFMPILW